MRLAYFDASALVKLVMSESESVALRKYLATAQGDGIDGVISSRITHIEVLRSVMKRSPELAAKARSVLRGVHLIGLSYAVVSAAWRLEPSSLRTLDAIHVASALQENRSLRHVVTYDERMSEACWMAGLEVVTPR